MNANILRGVLFSLVPIELATIVLIAAGVTLPTPLRFAIVTLLAVTVVAEVSLWSVTFARNRRSGIPRTESARNALRHVIGDRLWGFICAEFGVGASLARFVLRKEDIPPESVKVTYHRQSSPIMWTMVAMIVVEIIVLHLVIPWQTVRIIALVLSFYSLLWVIGFITGFTVHPHALSDTELVIRHGPTVKVVVPLNEIGHIQTKNRDLPGVRSVRYEGIAGSAAGAAGNPNDDVYGQVLHIAQGGRTNLDLTLRHPVPGPHNTEAILVHFWADEPGDLIRKVRARSGSQR